MTPFISVDTTQHGQDYLSLTDAVTHIEGRINCNVIFHTTLFFAVPVVGLLFLVVTEKVSEYQSLPLQPRKHVVTG